ncbi:MAG: hypothetical protein J6W60_13965 [Treponema sp.]|nr:hypothetical protein [Treponema sp.]MBP5753944.1 hypothetical protein [Treponema sp.]
MSDFDLAKLKEPFPFDDLEFRLQSCGEKDGKFWGLVLAYVTNRAIQNRLDEVVGPENWKNEFIKGPDGGILCGLSIKIDGEWVTKYDGAENTNIEAVKGGLSGAMKRAASTGWGIGRYLYNLKESWAVIAPDGKKGKYTGQTKDKKYFKWDPPALPAWALPAGTPLQVEGGTQAIIDLQKFLKDGALDDRPKMKAGAEQAIKDNDLEKIQKYIEACKGKKAS